MFTGKLEGKVEDILCHIVKIQNGYEIASCEYNDIINYSAFLEGKTPKPKSHRNKQKRQNPPKPSRDEPCLLLTSFKNSLFEGFWFMLRQSTKRNRVLEQLLPNSVLPFCSWACHDIF